ncbi:MAG: hypothetical protein ACRERC_20635, partial [Candidatus Binatia bacterium]
FLGVGGQGTFTDRPTITYTPLTGEKFLHSLILPIPTTSVLYTLQSGYAADFVLTWAVESLNGLHNRSSALGAQRDADPMFAHALELLRDIQSNGGIDLGVEEGEGKQGTTVAIFRAENLAPSTIEKSAELRALLRLPAKQSRFRVITSPGPGPSDVLTIQPRSLLQVMQAMSAFVEVPAEHLAQQWAAPGAETGVGGASGAPMRIRQSPEEPVNPYAAVQYQEHWFWIDQSDWRSKRALVLAMLLFKLTNSGSSGGQPVLTIPIN